MSDLHEVVFRWPYAANEVIVTGTFDKWTCSIRMDKSPSGFVATVRVPWEEKVLYKFIVDGSWAFDDKVPTEVDQARNTNNVYHAPTKPEEPKTPRYEPPAAQEPKIAPVPAPVPAGEKKEQLPPPAPRPTEEGSVEVPAKPEQPVNTVPVVPVNDTKPVDTPPAKTNEVAAPDHSPVILPTPANLKSPLVIVPVNDANAVEKQPPVVEAPPHIETPSTHALPVNSPRKASVGTTSSNTLSVEKKEEEPQSEVKRPNGTSNGIIGTGGSTRQPPATPVKDRIPSPPATPATPPKPTSPPTTPKKSHFFGSPSSSPSSSPSNTISRKGSFRRKRDSFIHKVKHLFTPEKDKEHHREKSHD